MLNLYGIQISVFIEIQPCLFTCVVYSCFHSIMAELSSCDRLYWCSQHFRLVAAYMTNHSDIVIIWQHFKCHLYFCFVTTLFFVTSAYSSCKNKNRKLDFECRTFRAQCSIDFIIKMQSIVFIMQWHYSCAKRIQIYIDITTQNTHHDIPNSQKTNGQKIRTFKMEYLIIVKFLHENGMSTKVSFQVAYEAKKSTYKWWIN